MTDQVNKPAHYQAERFECIDVIEHILSEGEFRGYLKGCLQKYLYRHRYKGHEEEDLLKAQWYLSRLLDLSYYSVRNEPTSSDLPPPAEEPKRHETTSVQGVPRLVRKAPDGRTFENIVGGVWAPCQCAECTWLKQNERNV